MKDIKICEKNIETENEFLREVKEAIKSPEKEIIVFSQGTDKMSVFGKCPTSKTVISIMLFLLDQFPEESRFALAVDLQNSLNENFDQENHQNIDFDIGDDVTVH